MHNKRYINHIQAPINILLRPHPSGTCFPCRRIMLPA